MISSVAQTRRRRGRTVVAAGVALAVMAALAACGSDDDDDAGSTTAGSGGTAAATTAPAATGGTTASSSDSGAATTAPADTGATTAPAAPLGDAEVTFAVGDGLRDIELCHDRRGQNARVLKFNVGEALVKLDPVNGPQPMLATSWQQLDDTHWEFTLRDGVKFHDGAPMDADAVVKSLTRAQSNTILCAGTYAGFFDKPFTATAKDPHTVEIALQSPEPILPLHLSFMDIVSPNTPQDEASDEAIGTGPYTLAEYVPDQSIRLERFDDYWGPKPQIKTATYLVRPSETVRAAMVDAGEADIALDIAAQDATGDDRTRSYITGDTLSYRVNNIPPLDNIDVRQAIAYAIDRDLLASTLLSPKGTPTSQMVITGNNAHIPDEEPFTYDLDKAKELVAKAAADGAPIDTPIDMIVWNNQYAGANDVGEAVAQMIEAIGLHPNVVLVDDSQWSEIRRNPDDQTNPQLVDIAHTNVTGDGGLSLVQYLTTTAPFSEGTDPEVDRLMDIANQESDPDLRAKDMQAVMRLGMSNANMISYMEMSGLMKVSDRIQYEVGPLTGLVVELADITVK